MNASLSLPGLRKLIRTSSVSPSATSCSGPFDSGSLPATTGGLIDKR